MKIHYSNVSRCVIWDSKLHCANKYQHRNDQNNINVVENIDFRGRRMQHHSNDRK